MLRRPRATASISQTAGSSSNFGEIIQGDGHSSSGNTASISQSVGSSNQAYIWQGVYDTAFNDQASVVQAGYSNYAYVDQTGPSKTAAVSQIGNGNSAIATQH